jgi:hypothetical protein
MEKDNNVYFQLKMEKDWLKYDTYLYLKRP